MWTRDLFVRLPARIPRRRAVVPPVDRARLAADRDRHALHSLALLGAMVLVLGFSAWLLGGLLLAALASVVLVALYLVSPRFAPRLLLRYHRCQPIRYEQAPGLHGALRELARRADLRSVPALYRTPSGVMNAFAVGDRDDAAVVVSDGLLAGLERHELEAVLAHEVAHVANDDMRVSAFAALSTRLTTWVSRIALLLVLVNLPLIAVGKVAVSWTAIALLLAAPAVSGLVRLAFSRTRELDADAGAVHMLGHGASLASALAKMERQGRRMSSLFGGGAALIPRFLRTHPTTEERLRRLASWARPRTTAFGL